MGSSIVDRAKIIQSEGIFLGGPANLFETAGQKLLITLLSEGLTPNSKVLDIGCGCLRGGYWLIHFLSKNCYFGIEPNNEMLDAGIRILLEPEELDLKKPRFDNNAEFDFTVFNEKYDFYVARSIWTHASKEQIKIMLDGFINTANNDGVFLTSYLRSNVLKNDYKGKGWIGRSHESDKGGLVHHSLKWIQKECATRELIAEEIKGKKYNFGGQRWIKIKRAGPL